jgi:hypothetical protein
MVKYNKPDLNAPRFRPKKHNILNESFCEKIRSKGGEFKDLDSKTIKNLITKFNGQIWETAIESRDGVELPEQLGYIFIGTCQKKKKDNPDVNASISYGVKVQHRNWESDQYLAKIFYTNFETKYRFKFHRLWGFSALRDFKRSVARTYPQNWKQYVVVDNLTQISRLFRKYIVKDILEKKDEEVLKTYDEFDLNF